MLAGMFRFVCCNGLVVGNVANDIRIPHKGNIKDDVIEGAFRVLDDFDTAENSSEAMKALHLDEGVVRFVGAEPPEQGLAQRLVQMQQRDVGRSR